MVIQNSRNNLVVFFSRTVLSCTALSFSLISLLVISLLTINQAAASPVDTYQFSDEVTKKRYQALVKELRCPKCQNQNLADSNSPIAADLRREVYELLQQGKADIEIVDFMVKRYGEFVLYRPRVSSLTYVLWFGPATLLFVGVLVVVFILRRKREVKQTQTLSQAQQDKLNSILNGKLHENANETADAITQNINKNK
ncbi:MAG: cytochrome c-type biogenesis protein CcmH [Alteromonadaceae bacterium]|nr:cytochrome c-type biogenesis protein CcmH [Alteromonadaceae bacterium]